MCIRLILFRKNVLQVPAEIIDRYRFACKYDKVKPFCACLRHLFYAQNYIIYIYFFSDSVAKHSVPVLVGRSNDDAYRTTAAGPPVAALLYNGNNNNIITAGRARP